MGDPLLPFAVIGSTHRDEAAKRIPRLAEIIERCSDRAVPYLLPEHVSVINLTEREHAILEKLAENVSVASIARAHYVSEATIKTQMRSLYAKLDAHSRDEAVAAAQTAGIIE
jgi:LuxR family maltose regulon positive regulatory protein